MLNSIKSNRNNHCISFCGCQLDPETQALQTEHGVVRLRSKLWLVLAELVRNADRVVLREDLVKDIWRGNNYTGEQGLTHAICHLRRLLKKHDVKAKIITLPKRGYILHRENVANEEANFNVTNHIDSSLNSYYLSPANFKISYTIG